MIYKLFFVKECKKGLEALPNAQAQINLKRFFFLEKPTRVLTSR
jgi:hypothetical protein